MVIHDITDPPPHGLPVLLEIEEDRYIEGMYLNIDGAQEWVVCMHGKTYPLPDPPSSWKHFARYGK
jgi:hypothetical protein